MRWLGRPHAELRRHADGAQPMHFPIHPPANGLVEAVLVASLELAGPRVHGNSALEASWVGGLGCDGHEAPGHRLKVDLELVFGEVAAPARRDRERGPDPDAEPLLSGEDALASAWAPWPAGECRPPRIAPSSLCCRRRSRRGPPRSPVIAPLTCTAVGLRRKVHRLCQQTKLSAASHR